MTASAEQKPTSTNSRRALLAGALGGIGAVAAGAVAKVSPVRAEGENIQVGGEYLTATSRTYLHNSANGARVFQASSTAGGWGIFGTSDINVAIYGSSGSHMGIYGTSGGDSEAAVRGNSSGDSTGVLGSSGAFPTAKPKTGVYGYANQDAGSKGVWGFSGRGAGVLGQANRNGFAIRAKGRIKADKVSGVATIPAGSSGVTVSPGVNVTAASFVLLTPKANIGSRGLWFTTNASADTFRIRMSSTRSANTKVAWLLLG